MKICACLMMFVIALGLNEALASDRDQASALQTAVDFYNSFETTERMAAALAGNAKPSDVEYLHSLKGKLPKAKMEGGKIRFDGLSGPMVFVNPMGRTVAIRNTRIKFDVDASIQQKIVEIEKALQNENVSILNLFEPRAHAITPLGAAGIYGAGVVGFGALCLLGESFTRSSKDILRYCAVNTIGWPVMLPVSIIWAIVGPSRGHAGELPKDLECAPDGSIGFVGHSGEKVVIRDDKEKGLTASPALTEKPGKVFSSAFQVLKKTCESAKFSLNKLNASSSVKNEGKVPPTKSGGSIQ